MPFFGKTYTLRRYGEDTVVNGYSVAGYQDISVFLDVQTMSDDEVIEAGGDRDKMMLKTFGDYAIRCAKQEDGVQSDDLLYNGRWYKCMSSRLSENTFIKHWTSTFELIPDCTNPDPEEDDSDAEETEDTEDSEDTDETEDTGDSEDPEDTDETEEEE